MWYQEIKFEVLSYSKGKYTIQFNMLDINKKTKWGLLVVYGSAHEEFLLELASFCGNMTIPYIVGDDFKYSETLWGRETKRCRLLLFRRPTSQVDGQGCEATLGGWGWPDGLTSD